MNQKTTLVLLAAAFIIAGCNETDSGSQTAAHAGPTMNFHRIDPELATGGHIVGDGVSELAEQGVSLVIDLRDEPPEGHDQRLADAGIRWVNVPVVWEDPRPEDFVEFKRLMDENEGESILVQCQGNYRASAMTYAYRVASGSASESDARKDLEVIWTPEGEWESYISSVLDTD